MEILNMIRIADLGLHWPLKHKDFVSDFCMETSDDKKCIMSVHIEQAMQECHGVQFIDKPIEHFLQRQSQVPEFLTANKDWEEVKIHCSDYNDPDYTLALAAICSRFSFFDTVLLHGSLVQHDGKGIVFTGYSGIGKTTQAELWNRYLDADIINGDKLFLRYLNDEVKAYGLPWKGSSPYCLNRTVPVQGIVVLRQAKENRIRRLSSLECMEYFLPHVFLPHWDKECLSRAIDTFERVLNLVPVWLLECRPDEDSVLLTHDTLFR